MDHAGPFEVERDELSIDLLLTEMEMRSIEIDGVD